MKEHDGDSGREAVVVSKSGYDLIRDPLLNKGTAFTHEERMTLGINGMLPSRVNTMEQQASRAFASIDAINTDLGKYVRCAALQDHNEQLFYRVLGDHIEELMPIIYTPTVGAATQNFSQVFQRGRGLWLTPDLRGQLRDILASAVRDRDIRLIVATDSESILGIGDQGAGGMAISIGKLALYVAGAGLDPATVLPICLDVGTNNGRLLSDELYLGWPERRLTGEPYDAFIDEFVSAVREACPNALLQWEDFRKDNALNILNRHRQEILSFNDDIQGTGAVALAGVLSGLRINGGHLGEQRVLIYGAGAAGLGIARQIKAALTAEHNQDPDVSGCLAVLDSRGLLIEDEQNKPGQEYKRELAWPRARAEALGLADPDQRQLANVVERFRPTVLIGTSGQPGAFDEAIIKSMGSYCERPIVLPFSNPTDRSEATPGDLLHWSEGRCLVATGSPFGTVSIDDRTVEIGQGNNVFIFPGLGLGALAAAATQVSDNMVSAASAALAASVTEDELQRGLLFPAMHRLQEVSKAIATAVAREAIGSGLSSIADEELDERLHALHWEPEYRPYRRAEAL